MCKIMLAVLTIGMTVLIGGCSTSSPKSGNQAAPTQFYSGWSTSQLQSKRTQLLREKAQADLRFDPVNGGVTSDQDKSGLNFQLKQIDAELLRRDPTGKLLGFPSM